MRIRHKQFVLLSGGLDSATVLYHVLGHTPDGFGNLDMIDFPEAISIDYGQRHSKELTYAKELARIALSPESHIILKMPDLLKGAMLTSETAEIPAVSYADLPHGISPTYVPFRNGLMLSMLAAHAQKWTGGITDREKDAGYARHATIYIGAHAEDASNDAYPDCSLAFMKAMTEAINIGTYGSVSLSAPLIGLQKSEVVAMGHAMGVPFGHTWSCYKGLDLHCGVCPTCRARKEAFQKVGIEDPTVYAA